MGKLTEPIQIVRAGTVPDGAGGFLAGADVTVFSGLFSVKRRNGTMTAEGFKPYLNPRYSFTGYVPATIQLHVGDVIIYRGERLGLIAPPLLSDDRRQQTLETQSLTP
ncbi:hypothetical protein F5984_13235 [Rudanella paleaurantiibacter]|uniref:Uncharacterized protein n=1 Tax=Rudanella paleaurantiibacter TaxID=2614655 RepID=A0A7J5TYJ1_9BACT|nr:hypothetical protein [Rudanella paleaurantiibacter]KAB7730141.1 hypothetical protein F5984_13235 [Rudanella paleaurantiibacter]